PTGELKENTTWDLIEDIEKLREHLLITNWIVVGGSWGATLALLYAQTYPTKVKSLILRGPWLNRPEDIHWLYQEGASKIFPEYWEEFIKLIPINKRDNIIQAYYDVFINADNEKKHQYARSYALWEIATCRLIP